MAQRNPSIVSTLPVNGQTIRDVISPWAGVGPLPESQTRAIEFDEDDEPSTVRRPRISEYASFGQRVQAALLPVLGSYVGDAAITWMAEEVEERGEPRDLISALALGHGLVTRIGDLSTRERARHALDKVLREVKSASLVPPPVTSSARPPRSADLDRCRNDE